MSKDFAIGLPSKENFEKIDQKGSTRLVIQKHIADRAGKHYDMRLHSGKIAHSWVIKSLPGEKDRILAIRQPTHRTSYSNFEGTIESGYGKGTVKKMYDKKVNVISASDDRIKIRLPEGTFTMIKPKSFGDKNWLMVKSAARAKKVPFTRAEQAKNPYIGWLPGDPDNKKRYAYAEALEAKRKKVPKASISDMLKNVPKLIKKASMNYEQIKQAAYMDELEKIAVGSQGYNYEGGKYYSDIYESGSDYAKEPGFKALDASMGGGYHKRVELKDPNEISEAKKSIESYKSYKRKSSLKNNIKNLGISTAVAGGGLGAIYGASKLLKHFKK